MPQHFEFGAPSPLDDDHELQVALAFDFDTPVAINPHPLTPAFMHPSHSALMRPLPSTPVASSSASQQAFVSDIDDSYIPPLPPLESYYDMEPRYLAPYHPLPDQISSFFPEFVEPVLSMDNDALLPVGADFHDEPRRDGIYGVEDALTQKNSGKRKRKDRRAKQSRRNSDGLHMEHFQCQPSKRAKVVSYHNSPLVHR
jgi:hypothetical protein